MASCKHVKIVNQNPVSNVEKFIKYIERVYDTDITSLPRWKEIINDLSYKNAEFKMKVQAANNRKKAILEKILGENRLSPFELTNLLHRTAHKWENMLVKSSARVSLNLNADVKVPEEYGEMSPLSTSPSESAHPNTEIDASVMTDMQLKPDDELESELSHLPIHVCTNQHKLISPLLSNQSGLSCKTSTRYTEEESGYDINEWEALEPTFAIKSVPQKIVVDDTSPDLHTVVLQLTNCSFEYLYVQFKLIINSDNFKYMNVAPLKPLKLLPGLSAKYKFSFILKDVQEEFRSGLFFKVGHNVYINMNVESLLIPFERVLKKRFVCVSEVVSLPPAYQWHVSKAIGFPSGAIKISNKGNYNFILNITKRKYDFIGENSDSFATGPPTDSLEERQEDEQLMNEFGVSTQEEIIITSSIQMLGLIQNILEEVLANSLDTFFVQRTYLELQPYSDYSIPVFFTKPEHVGLHQCYYNLTFIDPETNVESLKNEVQIHGEILESPIKIHPMILDMSNSIIKHGFREDTFTIYNMHKCIPVTVKIKLTTKMKRLFKVYPMETAISSTSKADFLIRLCSRDFVWSSAPPDEMAYFIIKIVFSGNKKVYEHMPPMFYEIMIPCSMEFKMIYNKKYFDDYA